MDLLKFLGYVKIKSVIYQEVDITNSNIEVINLDRPDIESLTTDTEVIAGNGAERDNITITELFNKAVEKYLNKYN